MKRGLLVTIVLLTAFVAPVRAAPLGSVRFAATGIEMTLRIEGRSIRGRRTGQAVDQWSWSPVGRPAGRIESPPMPGAASCDADIEAVLDVLEGPDDGATARIYVAATLGLPQRRSYLTALELSSDGSVRTLWSQDATSLPGLGLVVAAPTPLTLRTGGPRLVAVSTGWPSDPAADPRRSPGSLLLLDGATGRTVSTPLQTPASLTSGVTSIDLDGNGIADRIHAADAGFRLWRMDVQPETGDIERPSLVADLGELAAGDAAPVFAPDLALIDVKGVLLIRITLGSSNRPGRIATRHWLMQLDEPLGISETIRMADLQRVEPGENHPTRTSRGLLLQLTGGLAAPALTVAGKLIAPTSATKTNCRATTASVALTTISSMGPTDPHAIEIVRHPELDVSPDARLDVEWMPGSDGIATARCRLGESSLELCAATPRFTRDYWKRSDAP